MSGIDVLVLRRSIRLVHSLRKERVLLCSFLISNGGDIIKSSLRSNKVNHQNEEPIFQSFGLSRKMTDAAMEGLNGIQSKQNVEWYNSLLFMARFILEDEDSMAELKEESSNFGFLSVILSETFQTSLTKYNDIIMKLLESGILPFSPIINNENEKTNVQSNDFDLKKMRTKIIGDSSKLKTPITTLLECFFSMLKFLDGVTRGLINGRVNDRSKVGTTEYRISSLFAILIAIINLQESFLIEIICFQQLLCSKDSTNANGVISSFLGGSTKENPQVAVIVKILMIHFDFQQKLISTLKLAANNIDTNTCKNGQSVFFDLLERNLQQNEKISVLKEFVLKDDKKLKGIQKVITNNEFLKLSISQYERFHGLELSIIEEIEYSQIISDEVHPSLSQNKLSKTKKNAINWGLGFSGRSKAEKKRIKEITTPFANLSKAETKKMIGEMSPELVKSTLMSILNIELDDSRSMLSSNHDQQAIDEEDASLPLHLIAVVNEWQVDLEELKFKKRIGDGGAGTTYLSKWRREDVAVKVAAATPLGIFGWKKELEFLKNLHHPNVVRMLGCVYSETPFAMILVLEFCNLGNLGGILNRATPKNFFEKASLGLANGLSYLHSKGIFHRDIKPENILVHGDIEKGDFCVKIIDFGLSVFFDIRKYNPNLRRASISSIHSEQEEDYTAEAGTYRWMAPEIIRHHYYDFKCDTYSFGIVLWQLLTREKPYADKGQEDAKNDVSENLSRPPFPKNTPKKIQNLIEKCWSENPNDRPFCDKLCDMIESIVDDLNKDERKWLGQSYGHQVYSKMKAERPNNTDLNGDKDSKVRRRFSRKGSKIFRLSLSLK